MKNIKFFLSFILLFSLLSCSNGGDDLNISNSFNAGNNNGNNNSGNNNSGNNSNNNQTNPTGEEGEITLYSIINDNLVKIVDYNVSGQELIYQQDTQEHLNLWRLVKKIIPLNYRSKIGEFLIYSGENGHTITQSKKIKSDLSKWRLSIAINRAGDQPKLIFSIVHEFGFILTQNNDQVDASIRENMCSSYYNEFGCTGNSSYINLFQQEFWLPIWDSYIVSKGGSIIDMQNFYNNHSNYFFYPNSALSPEEDIADVFATFVTRENAAVNNSITEQKIDFMYNFSELVSLRNYIRTNLGS